MGYELYRINELYSASDDVQYIELIVGAFDGQSNWAGVTLTSTLDGVKHSYTFPTDLPSTATANTTVLLATQGFADGAGVKPDFIIPAGFLFPLGGATLNFGNVDVYDYPPLLTPDSVASFGRGGRIALEPTPKNFAGVTAPVHDPIFPLMGTAANDSLVGRPGGEDIGLLAGNDQAMASDGHDNINGGSGIDPAVYPLSRGNYTLRLVGAGQHQVDKPSSSGLFKFTDHLVDIERLQFSDASVALELDGHAGQVAKLLGAVFGKEAIGNKAYAGAGLALLDGGMGYEALATLALQVAGKSSAADVVALLWTNLVGSAPTAADAAPYIAMLDGGMTIGALAVMAADLPLNAANIDLAGLAQTGLAYTS